MQIWMPSNDLIESARILDSVYLKRTYNTICLVRRSKAHLSNKIPKAQQLLMRQWVGQISLLTDYANWCHREWTRRGLSLRELERHFSMPIGASKGAHETRQTNHSDENDVENLPWWWGNLEFHNHHKAKLLALNYIYYSQFGWPVIPEPLELGLKYPTNFVREFTHANADLFARSRHNKNVQATR